MRMRETIAAPVHGGNAAAIATRYDLDPASLLDFSANVDPFGPPPAVRAAIARIARAPRGVANYPEPTAKPLREAIARHHGIDAASVLVANGSTALLDAIVRGLEPEATVVPVPAFSEYRRAIRSARSRFVAYPLDTEFEWNDVALLDRIAGERAKLLVLTNPHNPSGRLVSRERLAGLIEGCARRDAYVVVDEAFIDYAFVQSLIGLRAANLVVVRSLTKFYGMAGIRAGYAVVPVALAPRIAAHNPSWPIGSIDIAAACAALDSGDYDRSTRDRNRRERARLARGLRAYDITVFPSEANFLLLELPCVPATLEALEERLVREHRIVVRDCRTYEGLEHRSIVRVAVRKRAENERLVGALAECLRQ
jgi:threonine-phosphate decarboxylase